VKDTDFFSNNIYIVLPTRKNPKVYLAIDGANVKFNSFKLYNPFSKKAKILKFFAFLYPKFNIIKKEKTDFIKYIEKLLQQNLTVSTYISTDKDKAIIQLQTDSKIIGYMKVGLTSRGNKRVENEIRAIEILQKINPIEIIKKGVYRGHQFVITKNIDGHIGNIQENDLNNILSSLKRNKMIPLKDHPRVKNIYVELKKLNLQKFLAYYESLNLNGYAMLVFEHGDFAPWNIMKQKSGYKLFDLEYFVEDGLEYFDLIKYHYQISILLHNDQNDKLLNNILNKIDHDSKIEIFSLFILKEIIIKINEKKSFDKEEQLMKLLSARKS